MLLRLTTIAAIAALLTGTAFAQNDLAEIDKPASKLEQILAEGVALPAGEQEVRVVRATIDPKTVAAWHTHPTPVYLYIMDGTLTMEVEGRESRQAEAGVAIAEPLNARMRVKNEGDTPVEVVVFQISPPQEKFLEQEQQKTN